MTKVGPKRAAPRRERRVEAVGDAIGGQFPTWILSIPEHCLLLLLLLMGVATAEVDKLNRFVESAAEATFALCC